MNFLKKHWSTILIFFIVISVTYPFCLKGLIPAPLDFLVNFYAPWSGVDPAPVKNPAIADVVNQIIPFKLFSINQLKQGILPLWNPFNLAGTPHLANWQSAVFYPLNLLFFIFSFTSAWSLFIIAQPLLAAIFTYLYCQTLKLSKPASLLGSISFAFSGFLTTWFEWGTLGHAILWLPLSLWAIEHYLIAKKIKFLILNSIFLSFSLLAGHLQISLYVIIFSLIYYLFKRSKVNRSNLNTLDPKLLLWCLPFLLTAFQLFPSIELYLNSARAGSYNPGWYHFFQIPFNHLITFLAPDFFGSPTTRNLWGNGSYVEMMGYVGIVPLILALSSVKLFQKNKFIKFYWITIIISLVLALKNPISNIVLLLRLPVFASSSPARIIGIVSFSLAILAAIAFDKAQKHHFKTSLKVLSFLLFLVISTFVFIPSEHALVAQRNLILPTATVLIFICGSYFLLNLKVNKKLLIILNSLFIILVASGDLFRFHHKFNPYTDKKLFYPNVSIIQKLQNLPQPNYTFGLFDANLNLPFNLYSLQGYDPFIFARYPELISSHKSGLIDLDSKTTGVQINKNDPHTIALTSLLNAKYFIQPTVHGAAAWELHLWEYPDQFEMLFEDENFQIHQNLKAQDYYFLTSDYQVITQPQSIIDHLLDPQNTSVILENQPPFPIASTDQSPGEIFLTSLSSNRLDFKLNTTQPTLFYINSNFYPGWQALVDDQIVQILRANYSFKAIPIPQGAQQLVLIYKPSTFTLGLYLSMITAGVLLITYLYVKDK